MDHSIVESFAQGGKVCITSRVYPTKAIGQDAHLFVFNAGNAHVHIKDLEAWEMETIQINTITWLIPLDERSFWPATYPPWWNWFDLPNISCNKILFVFFFFVFQCCYSQININELICLIIIDLPNQHFLMKFATYSRVLCFWWCSQTCDPHSG